ncbi:MAG TPA: tRNA (adenosine(37)-N6)-dimethylallyltransferase MiaA [Acidiferrobacteraceae bacterium]|nr:tRNA (adenosine(37)-N6)-dimethylallyltransferase MiaA [Acidiferrobacteraceae bacterium]
MGNKPKLVFIMGPTAAGKSAVALDLAEAFPAEIISVDSSQVYRGMDIGTAKPSVAEQSQVPHHLINIRDPAQPYSAAQFRGDATVVIDKILRRQKIPLLVGGTLFYYRALEQGLSELPEADESVRQAISADARQQGWPALHANLAKIDPETARRIQPQDGQRIQRALEIWRVTGETPSKLNRRQPQIEFPYEAVKLVIAPGDRAVLHQRIAVRFRQMLDQGLVAEVRQLAARSDLVPSLPAMRTVGYRQVLQYLSGEVGYTEMVDRGIFATRQLAKRQLTWLRGETGLTWFDSSQATMTEQVRGFLASNGLPTGL